MTTTETVVLFLMTATVRVRFFLITTTVMVQFLLMTTIARVGLFLLTTTLRAIFAIYPQVRFLHNDCHFKGWTPVMTTTVQVIFLPMTTTVIIRF